MAAWVSSSGEAGDARVGGLTGRHTHMAWGRWSTWSTQVWYVSVIVGSGWQGVCWRRWWS